MRTEDQDEHVAPAPGGQAPVRRVAVATDRSPTAERAVAWAADMANRYGAELVVIQVLPPESPVGTQFGQAEATRAGYAGEELTKEARRLAGDRGRARVVVDENPAAAIVRAAEEAVADLLVVGNAGMSGRKEFLLGNVPNRVSHIARCSVVIVNTVSDGETRRGGRRDRARAPAAGADKEVEVEGPLLGRAPNIGRVMAKHGVSALFAGTKGDKEETNRARASKMRAALDELGPTFAKLGQILSTRPDLLPPEFIQELATLQDNVTPLTEAEVVVVMEQELGVPWEDVFESIDPKPLAAGTIAQVHRATLETGERVVVKVQRPTAREDIMRDLGLLKMFAEKTEGRPAFKQVVDMGAVVQHLSESLQRELDFRREAANIDRMRGVLESYDRLDVPSVYHELSTSRFLVMEEIQGIAIRQAPEGPDRTEAARQLMESYYRQILTDGFFHADPHPGNLMWWQDRIYFLDFGMVGEVGPEVRQLLLLMLMAFWQEDVPFLADVVLMLTGEVQKPDLDIEAFRTELDSLMAKYRHMALSEIQMGPMLQEVTEIAIRHDVPLPASLTLTAKALAQMQLATAELDPTLDPFEVAGAFVMRDLGKRIRGQMDLKKMFYEGQKIRVRLVKLIESFETLAGSRAGPKLAVNFRGLDPLETAVRRAARRLSLALAAGGALVATAVTAASTHVAGWVPATLGSTSGVLILGLVVDLVRREPRSTSS